MLAIKTDLKTGAVPVELDCAGFDKVATQECKAKNTGVEQP